MKLWLFFLSVAGVAGDLPPLAYEHGLADFSTTVEVETSDKHVKAFVLGGHNFQKDAYGNQSQEMMALDLTDGTWQYHVADVGKPLFGAGLGLAADKKTLISVGGCSLRAGYPQSTRGVYAFTNLVDTSGGQPEVKHLGDLPPSAGEQGSRCRGAMIPTNMPHLQGGYLLLGGYGLDVTGQPALWDHSIWFNASSFLEGKPQGQLLNFTADLPTHGLMEKLVVGPVGDFFATVVDDRWVYAMGGSQDWQRDSCSPQCLKMDLMNLHLDGKVSSSGKQGGCGSKHYGACWEACAHVPFEVSGKDFPEDDGKCGMQGVYLPKLRKIVIMGGKTRIGSDGHYATDTSNKVFSYNVDTDTWSDEGSVEHQRAYGGAAAMPDGKSIAVFGGTNYDARFKDYLVVNETDVFEMKSGSVIV